VALCTNHKSDIDRTSDSEAESLDWSNTTIDLATRLHYNSALRERVRERVGRGDIRVQHQWGHGHG
jgi:hypothetical protein